MAEVWKDVPGYEGLYKASSSGRIIPVNRKHDPKIKYSEKDGYLRKTMSKNKKRNLRLIHRIIAQTFIPNPENKKYINHKNGIKTDNRVENLEWSTPSENLYHSRKELKNIHTGKPKEVIDLDTGIFYDSIRAAHTAKGYKHIPTYTNRLVHQNKISIKCI